MEIENLDLNKKLHDSEFENLFNNSFEKLYVFILEDRNRRLEEYIYKKILKKYLYNVDDNRIFEIAKLLKKERDKNLIKTRKENGIYNPENLNDITRSRLKKVMIDMNRDRKVEIGFLKKMLKKYGKRLNRNTIKKIIDEIEKSLKIINNHEDTLEIFTESK